MIKTILLVENDKLLRDMFDYKFKKAGYKVVNKTDAKSALAWLEKNKVDLVILDIILPKINGIKLIKNIRKNIAHKSAKIIILTHLNQSDVNMHSIIRDSLGVDGYFVKSQISPDKLVENVNTILR